ncbi:AEC family transporter [Cupriavidus basilensis]|uniref:AEC family transporter n=1 Tax=Cupriavidus basilensis TaxID=68895 RepID=UPI0039F6C11A
MLNILAIIAPIYILILIGFATTRAGLFAKADMRVFGKFVINLALPALLLRALSQRQVGEILNVSYLLAYCIGSWAVIGLGYAWCRRVSRLNPATSAFYAMGMSCSNSGFIGYPILLLTLAPVAGVSLALNMTVENLLVIPFLLFMAERKPGSAGRWQTLGKALARLICNPMILGLLAGLTVSVLGLTLPAPVTRTVDTLATACSALSLFVIGGTLVGLPMGGLGSRIAPIVVGKLVLHPLCVLLAITMLPMLGLPEIDRSLSAAAVLMAAMPMMGIYATLGQAYGQEEFSAVTLLITTIASFFTLSALLFLLGAFHALP